MDIDASHQATRQANQNDLDRCRAVIFGGEHLGMIGIVGESRLVLLLFAEAEETLDLRVAVGTIFPFIGRPPCELGCLRRFAERLARAEQRFDIHPIVDSRFRT